MKVSSLIAVVLLGMWTSQAVAGLVDSFGIVLKQTVSNGVPGPGAGNLEAAGASDVYTFTVDPGTSVYFQELSGGCNILWRCVDSTGTILFNNNAICVTDPGTQLLEQGGDYTITVYSNAGATGSYSFVLWALNPTEVFEIDFKQTVSNGNPLPGAGNLEEPGAVDQYTLEATAGEQVYFDEIAASACAILWSCQSPSGELLFSNNAVCVGDPGVFTLEETGPYTISVHSGSSGLLGTYSFKVWQLNPPEVFEIGLKQTVSNGNPAAGAGNLEEPGAIDIYRFEVEPGTLVYFDELAAASCSILWNCRAPDGSMVFAENAVCITDSGAVLLTQEGEYEIAVYTNTGATGTYSFVLLAVNPIESFDIQLEQQVSEGKPQRGAGHLEEPGAIDDYVFTVQPNTLVFFDALSGTCAIQWECFGPAGSAVFANQPICATDPGVTLLEQGGEYVIRVSSQSGAEGVYSFIVWEVNLPEVFNINIDEAVSEDVPLKGAGFIEEPGAIDEYVLSLSAGDVVCFEQLSGSCSFGWECLDPDGDVLWSDPNFCVFPPGKFVISEPGEYVISVFGNSDGVGAYSFIVNTGKLADINGDCHINVDDLLIVINTWGSCPNPPDACEGDVVPSGGDGVVDVDDLLAVINGWG